MIAFGKALMRSAVAIGLVLPISPVDAALLHQYSFDNTTNDAVGGMNATLEGNAQVTANGLVLNGTLGTYAQISGYAIPTSDFTITFDATITAYNNGQVVEMISQGYSGAPGFYIGLAGGQFRLGDQLKVINVPTPSLNKQYSYELASNSSGTQFYIDGTEVFTSSIEVTAPQTGTTTRVGNQFDPYNENFNGTISDLSIYSGAASVPEPASLVLLGSGIFTLALMRRRARRLD